ncbi:hypothetical protein [Leptolyngbya ohadii]|uniref:hypothetical protein n=1 Tax=Leptolyngbya ohadii TaxID=1962290 RepID=UPI000B599486|nr:hypothetical protein [Leptolyngbya ohadii]
MNQLAKDISAEVLELLHHYGFDLGNYSAHALVDYWLQQYPAPWIRLATIEALYQGRYKAISVEQILNLWRRRTRTLYHFNSEFERMISLRPMLSAAPPVASQTPERGTNSAPPNRNRQPGQIEAFPLEAIDSGNPGATPGRFNPSSIGSSRTEEQPVQYPAHGFSGKSETEEIRRIPPGEPLPIDQFTPTLEVSDFYWRLKAVVRAMGADAEEVSRRN